MISRKALLRVTLFAATAVLLSGCVRLTIAWAPLTPKGQEAAPALLGPLADSGAIDSRAAWESSRRDLIREELQRQIYGYLPEKSRTEVLDHRIIDESAFSGIGVFEEFDVAVQPVFGTGQAPTARFTMAVLSPKNVKGPVPVIMGETFCPRWNAIPHPDAKAPSGAEIGAEQPFIIRNVFGRYICMPPLEMILDEGFALAVVAATDVVPDHGEAGLNALNRLAAGHDDPGTRWGAIAAWGWTFSRMVDVLEAEERFDGERLVAYGHSRYGKAALVAGAFDDRIAGVIAHQSGTGGASLNRKKSGESIEQITSSFPHWFASNYATYADSTGDLTVDQHHLLALLAPRPVMLGNARRDVWSDPNGTFKAAEGARPIYALYGSQGLTAERLDTFRPNDDVSFWLRPGTHGVVEEDWPAFLAFLGAHFGD
ncbi:MAG: hypothetical protein AAF317_08205 [Pseudomonadota bacterium]